MQSSHRQIPLVLPALSLILCLLVSCGPGSAPPATPGEMVLPDINPVVLTDGEKLRVVATTSIIGDVVRNIGGDRIDLAVLMDAGQDPHSYQPVAQDLAAIETAHIIFINGLGLEESLLDSIEATATGPIVPVSASLEPIPFEGEPEHEEEEEAEHLFDPHFWLDPNNVMVWAENITAALSSADPRGSDAYRAGAEAYTAELEALDAFIRQQVALIPPANRKLVTDHASFGYFAEEYGFEQIGTVVPGVSTTVEPSAGDLAKLVEMIQEQGVTAIFVSTASSSRLQELSTTIAQEAGTDISILTLYIGALDVPGQPGDTYLGMMRYNLGQIVNGLG